MSAGLRSELVLGGPDGALPAVLEEAYASTVDPTRYEELLDTWERYMVSLAEAGDDLTDASAVYATHFSRALEILDRLGRQQNAIDLEQAAVDAITWPAFICNGVLQVSASNRSADVALPCRIESFHPDQDLVEQVVVAIDGWGRKQGQTCLLPLMSAEGKLRNCVIITELAATTSQTRPTSLERRFLVALANIEFDESIQLMLRERFTLTSAELLTLERLVQGYTAEQMSQLRCVTINTTRKQIRGLLEKTGASSQTDLIRLVVALVSQVGESRFAVATNNARTRDARDWRRITLRDGRQLSYLDFGDPEGRPVLFLHHMMGGPMWLPDTQALAMANGWRVIAPSRPGFGFSDPVSLHGQQLLDQTVDDICALLDFEAIPAVVVMGVTASSGLAARFVVQQPKRSLAMLNVGLGGLVDDELILNFPKRLRIIAQTWRKSEVATRLLARVGVAAIDIRGARRHLETHVAHAPLDMEAIADDTIRATLADGLAHSAAQGVDAFCKDGFVSLTDWSELFEQATVQVPSCCVVGEQDLTMPLSEVRRLLKPLTEYSMVSVREAGQTVFCTHGPVVMRELEKLWLRSSCSIQHSPQP